ncbi:PKD domain-containing protein [Thermodesulfobacteriota bacterium]
MFNLRSRMCNKFSTLVVTFLSLLILSTFLVGSASAATLTVDPTFGNAAYYSLNAAINAAVDGDTILANDGTYGENVYIWKNVDVKSVNGPAFTKIEGMTLLDTVVTFWYPGIHLTASIDGFTITNGYGSGSGTSDGGGLVVYDCTVTVKNCIINNNLSFGSGGGVHISANAEVTLTNCTVSNNSNYYGAGGIYSDSTSSLSLTNCTVSNNTGGGIASYGPLTTITNTILWGNYNSQLSTTGGPAMLDYCNVQGGYASGTNVIDADPLFTFAAGGNQHILTGSPCIDAGTALGAPADDVDGDPRAIGVGVDIGADEFNPSSFATRNVPGTYGTIQSAINVSTDGDLILVAPGTYVENLSIDKNVVLRAVNGHATTIIDGSASGSVVTYAPGLAQSGGIDGFTITNGNSAGDGGGVNAPNSSPTVANCNIKGNSAAGNGGGISVAGGNVQNLVNCLITDNTAAVSGGGINSIGEGQYITNCTVSNNTAGVRGGGIYADSYWAKVSGTIFWGDTSPEANEMYGGGNWWIEFSSTIMDGRDGWWWGGMDIDPQFVDAAAGDYHLQPTSPAIDTSYYNDAFYIPLKDIDGNPRAGSFDIGAYEYSPNLNAAPIADAGTDISLNLGGTANLSGALSTDPDADPLTYLWTLDSAPAGSSATLATPTAVTTNFIPDVVGDYVVSLVVHDGTEASTPSTITITALNNAPIANAGADQVISLVGSEVQLDGYQAGLGSYDPDDDLITYAWEFVSAPASSTTTLVNASTATPTFTADVNGDYLIRLTVSDGLDSAEDEVLISFNNVPPVSDPGTYQAVILGNTVNLDGTGSVDANLDPLTYYWSFISTPAGSTAILAEPSEGFATFTPDMLGSYEVSLIVNDGIVDSLPSIVTITVITANEAAALVLVDTVDVINIIVPENFRNPGSSTVMLVEIDKVLKEIDKGHYQVALDKLNSLLSKTDGCALRGAPDTAGGAITKDEIQDCTDQQEVYDNIVNVIGIVEGLL